MLTVKKIPAKHNLTIINATMMNKIMSTMTRHLQYFVTESDYYLVDRWPDPLSKYNLSEVLCWRVFPHLFLWRGTKVKPDKTA